MSSPPEETRLTWNEYLKFEAAYDGDEKFELHDGRVRLRDGRTIADLVHPLEQMDVWQRELALRQSEQGALLAQILALLKEKP